MHNFKIFKNFAEGIQELYDLVPNLRPYLKRQDGTCYNNPRSLVYHLMYLIKEDYPKSRDGSYSLSVSAMEVGFKTHYSVSFGWKPQYQGGFSFRVSVFDFLTGSRFTYREDGLTISGGVITRKDENGNEVQENISDILKAHGWINEKSIRMNPSVYGSPVKKKKNNTDNKKKSFAKKDNHKPFVRKKQEPVH